MSTSTQPADVGARGRTGIWFIGARGSVATTATIGSLAVTAGLADDTGLVSELAPIQSAAAQIQLADLVTADMTRLTSLS